MNTFIPEEGLGDAPADAAFSRSESKTSALEVFIRQSFDLCHWVRKNVSIISELQQACGIESRACVCPAATRDEFAIARGVTLRILHPTMDAVESRRISTNNRSEEHTSELQSLMRISYAV